MTSSRAMGRHGRKPLGRSVGTLAAIGVLAVSSSVLRAQDEGDEEVQLQVVEVKEVDNKPVIWSMITMGLLIAMAVGANAIPSRRGHQD